MTTNPIPNHTSIQSNTEMDNEIDLSHVYNALFRHRKLIAKIAAASILLTGIYTFTRKPVWRGHFEIVLASAQSASSPAISLLQSNPALANLIGASGGDNQLETES